MKKRIEYILKHSIFIQWLYRVLGSAFFRLVGTFVRTNPKLVLINGHGYKFNDSPRSIYLEMIDLGLDKELEIVWALKDVDISIPGKCSIIKMDTWKYFITALKAKYWISCVNIERGLNFKKKNTVYLNTWHGALINLCGNAVKGRKDYNGKRINYFCVNSDTEAFFFKRDFKLSDNSLLKIGYPRNDRLYRAGEEEKAMLKKLFGVDPNKKIIVYAPTWRDSEDEGSSYKLVPPIDWALWKKRLGNQYVVFLRTHPYTTQLMGVIFDEFIKDYSNYSEVNDILLVADILISDYSSIALDYCILEKPLLCFGYDYDSYKETRGFYYDLNKKMPYGVIKDQEELLDLISSLDYKEASQKTKKLKDEFMIYGGNASEKCIDILFGEKI